PQNDPTLLFTNAGMVQFKDVFTGREKRDYIRAASSQKCVRAGGKHNDLENVGFTARHHTFFEMLGNFSFGDYFKKEAIAWAWEFVTKTLGLPVDRLAVTVFREDDEAEELWRKVGVRKERIFRLGEKDNFWAMGPTGPCGPCSEIHLFRGDPQAPQAQIDEHAHRFFALDQAEQLGSDSWMEIWNLVFMQFERKEADGPLQPLPKPSNEGRGYVLRRILRRAIRHAQRLSKDAALFAKVCAVVIDTMGDAYPELRRSRVRILETIQHETDAFLRTLERGVEILRTTMGL